MLSTITSFFINNAYAAEAVTTPANAQTASSGFSFATMLVVFFLFMYFAIWRPQSKRAREQQNLMTSLNKGDEIMTTGGILGRISKLDDQYIGLTIANNVEIVIQKSSIVTVLPKGTLKSIE